LVHRIENQISNSEAQAIQTSNKVDIIVLVDYSYGVRCARSRTRRRIAEEAADAALAVAAAPSI
jgi:dephospho-CoA kinase